MSLPQIFESVLSILTIFIQEIGYFGIFIGMFLESTIFPLPSEVIMIPAGLSAASGAMNIYLVIVMGVLGNLFGAIFSYYLATSIGRTILFRAGKYFFIKAETIIKIEEFFKKHGPISVLIGRFLPGFRHFISLPAGVAKMNLKLFCLYTTVGSTIWTSFLSILGFAIGNNKDFIKEHSHAIVFSCFGVCLAIIAFYVLYRKISLKKRKI